MNGMNTMKCDNCKQLDDNYESQDIEDIDQELLWEDFWDYRL